MGELRDAILAGAGGEELAAIGLPETYRAAFVRRDETTMFEGLDSADKDPRKSLHVSEVATPGAGPRRGLRGRDGVGHQLQHRVDVDLRAPAHLRLPRPPGQGERVGGPPRPAVPRGRVRRLGRRAQGRAHWCATGSRATRSSSTATTSTTRTRPRTTTPCWPPTSASGVSRRTSGAWPTWRGEGEPDHAKGDPPHVGRRPPSTRLCNSTAYRMLASRNGAVDEAGRHGARVGSDGWVWAPMPCNTS